MIDSHCHLYFDSFENRQAELIAEATASGVEKIVNIGIDLESSRQAIDLAEKYDSLFATVGVHPHDASTYSDSVEKELRTLASHTKVVAIGEIGLDFYRDNSPRPVQREVFRKQLEMAVETGLPIVIHMRESLDECLQIVTEYAHNLAGGVFHCYPGTAEQAEAIIGLGFKLGIGGVVTFEKSRMSKVVTQVPLESIILETDAPFLAPVPHRGATNRPAYVKHVCDKVAELKEISSEQVDRVTTRTCTKLFRLAETFEG